MYSATPAAVPFLIELADSPIRFRHGIVELLGAIACATGYTLAHHVLSEPKERDAEATLREMEQERVIVHAGFVPDLTWIS